MEKQVDVSIIMGSDSDLSIMKDAAKFLEEIPISSKNLRFIFLHPFSLFSLFLSASDFEICGFSRLPLRSILIQKKHYAGNRKVLRSTIKFGQNKSTIH